jgi:hypothetical protein
MDFNFCSCGLTGGCPMCRPDTQVWPGVYSPVPVKTTPKGWMCPKCDCVNAPGNDRCVQCSPLSAAIPNNTFRMVVAGSDIPA